MKWRRRGTNERVDGGGCWVVWGEGGGIRERVSRMTMASANRQRGQRGKRQEARDEEGSSGK